MLFDRDRFTVLCDRMLAPAREAQFRVALFQLCLDSADPSDGYAVNVTRSDVTLLIERFRLEVPAPRDVASLHALLDEFVLWGALSRRRARNSDVGFVTSYRIHDSLLVKEPRRAASDATL